MSRAPGGSIIGAGEGAVAGTHEAAPDRVVLAAPAVKDELNTVRASIVPLACWRMEDIRFAFGSSVITPDSKNDFPLLAELIDQHTEPRPVPGVARPANQVVPRTTIFGHADPVGDDEFNKRLSGRRAAAVYGMVTRHDEVWEDLFSNTGKFAQPAPGDVWGVRSLQIMLNALPADPPAEAAPKSAGAGGGGKDADGFPTGLDPTDDLEPSTPEAEDPKDTKLLDEPLDENNVLDPPTRAAIKKFQGSARGRAAGLKVDGEPGPKTRKELFLAYMDVVCINGEAKPFTIDKEKGFIGRGHDAAGKFDFQGCSEFNPVMVFSKSERAAFDSAKDKTARNAENAVNRRVLVLLFRPGVTVQGFWPCPRAKEGTGDCRKRFWSDGEKRRSPTDERREFADTHNTFACRFYQRMTTGSPCERALSDDRVVVRMQLHDPFYEPHREQSFVATGEGGFFERGTTDGEGMLAIKVPRSLSKVDIRYTPKELGVTYVVKAALVPPEQKDDPAHLAHLKNFGFDAGKPSSTVMKFQGARKELDLTGKLDGPTKNAVNELLAGKLDKLGTNRG